MSSRSKNVLFIFALTFPSLDLDTTTTLAANAASANEDTPGEFLIYKSYLSALTFAFQALMLRASLLHALITLSQSTKGQLTTTALLATTRTSFIVPIYSQILSQNPKEHTQKFLPSRFMESLVPHSTESGEPSHPKLVTC